MKRFAQTLLLLILASTISASQQVSTGTPPFGSFAGGPFDTVNLGNLNNHFAIPLIHQAGRGMSFDYDLSYDGSVWQPVLSGTSTQWQPVYNWGWRAQSEVIAGYVTYLTQTEHCIISGHSIPWTGYVGWAFHDRWGVVHQFGMVLSSFAPTCGVATQTATAVDGSGYTMTASYNSSTHALSATVFPRAGGALNPPLQTGSGAASVTDSNGNQITVNVSGQFFGTLSATTPVLTVSQALPPGATTFTYPAPADGASDCNPITDCASYTVNYTLYTVKTSFGVSNSSGAIVEYGPLSNPLVSSISLPDGSSYTFTYEKTPGSCSPLSGTYSANCVTGRMATVTLPTGGKITYNYSGGTNNTGIYSDGSTAGLTRILSPSTACASGGCWQYTRTLKSGTPGAGSTWQTTMVDPAGNNTVINFAEDGATVIPTYNLYETQRQIYQGTVSASNLLTTTIRCYNGVYSGCPTATVSSPITQTDAYSELPNGSTSLSEILYNTYGLVTDDKEYNYGVTMGSAPGNTKLVRETATAYASLGNGIVNRPSSVTVYDWTSGTQTKIASSAYTYDQTTPTPTSGTPQHTSISGTARGNLTTQATQANASTTLYQTFTYYDTGNLNTATGVSTSSTTPGPTSTYVYGTSSCGNSFPTAIDEPLSLSVSTTWNCTGGVATLAKDVNSNPTGFTYADPNYWRLTSTSFPDGGSSSVTYNFGTTLPWNITTITPKDSSTNVKGKTVLDGFGRVVQAQSTSDPTGNIDYVDTVYDAVGRVASVSNPYQTTSDPTYGVTQYSYDALNRITLITHPDNTKATYNYSGAATQVIDEGSNSGGTTQVQKIYQSDGLGRTISVCEVSGATQLGGASGTPAPCGQDIAKTGFLTSYGYDALGNLTSVAQGSLSRTYAYDLLSRLTQEINPESGTTAYTYDTVTAGDLYRRTRPKPNQTGSLTVTTTYSYDALHRLTNLTYNDGTPGAGYYYDQSSPWGVNAQNFKGRVTQAQTDNGVVLAGAVFSYDAMGRVTGEWQCTPLQCGTTSISLTNAYDYLGDVTSRSNSFDNVTYTYSYDTLARFTKLQSSLSDSNHPGTLVTINTYNPLGEITKATLGNGIVRTLGYDDRGRLASLADGSIYNFSLGYAPDSDIVTGNDSANGNWSYTYDDFNRVSASNKNSGSQTFSYVYDRYSNRWQQNAPQGGPAPQYTFNGNNQITASGVSYDAAGNITNDGLGNTYTYDAENRVIAVGGNNAATYVYDAFGRRVRSIVNGTAYDFLYNGNKPIDEIQGTTWVWGDAGGLQAAAYANSTTYFNHSDWLGTARVWSNVSGASAGSCTSLVFGDAQTCSGTMPTPWQYTGLQADAESGLSHTLYRQLSTTQGRWTAADPAGLGSVDTTNPQTWNRYAYVMNSPLTLVDPLGLWCQFSLTLAGDSAWYTLLCGSNTDGGGGGIVEGGFLPPAYLACESSARMASCAPFSLHQKPSNAANNLQPWQRRASVVAILRAKNGCSGWFNTGTGSAADIMSQVRILNIAPPGNLDIPGPDAQTSPDPISPIDVYTNGRFWPNSANGLPVGSMFPPGSPGAQTIILLHELAHKTGLIPSDGFSSAQSDQNTQTVMGQCAAAINQ